jgi:regulator of protease activity HflC (stomatin/prohibitin superfamily)
VDALEDVLETALEDALRTIFVRVELLDGRVVEVLSDLLRHEVDVEDAVTHELDDTLDVALEDVLEQTIEEDAAFQLEVFENTLDEMFVEELIGEVEVVEEEID